MSVTYAIADSEDRPFITFERREDAEAYAAELGKCYYVIELPSYPANVHPQRTTWWRAGGQVGARYEVVAYPREHWDWQPADTMLDPTDDGVLRGGTNSERFPYFYCESTDPDVAVRVVKDAIESYVVPA